ncbi:hypothetical protein WJ438_06350 [Streptomyces sp. GD-15H]|uniref:hypothetical protein n=1 Tax=Streptomyces sp. GD-15H TaxID=3129112 RepID=UPI0032548193
MSFAREAAARARLRSRLTALPLIAWYEHHGGEAQAADIRAPHRPRRPTGCSMPAWTDH